MTLRYPNIYLGHKVIKTDELPIALLPYYSKTKVLPTEHCSADLFHGRNK